MISSQAGPASPTLLLAPLTLFLLFALVAWAPEGCMGDVVVLAAGLPIDVDLRTRNQWKELDAICPNRNFTSCETVDRSKWTDPRQATFSTLKFNGLGQWSFVTMFSHDKDGIRKTKGGDR